MPPFTPEQLEALKAFAVIVTIVGGISTALYNWAAKPLYALVRSLSQLQGQLEALTNRLDDLARETQRDLGRLEGELTSVVRRLNSLDRRKR